MWIQTQVAFKDESGSIIDESIWDRRRLDPMGTIQIDRTAQRTEASDFVVRVRWAR